MRLGTRSLVLLIAGGLSLPREPAASQEAPGDASIARLDFTVDNDFFDFRTPPRRRPDDNYSHGISFRRTNLPIHSPRVRSLCGAGGTCTLGVGVAQLMFTPERDSAPPPLELRPYAGILVSTLDLRSVSDVHLRAVSLSLGVSGGPSGAERVQEVFHRSFGFREVEGWQYQVPFEPLLGIEVTSARVWSIGSRGWSARLVPSGAVSLGNLRTGARLGFDVESGWSLGHPFGLTPGTGRYSAAIFGGAAADYRLHVVELDGTISRRSPSVDGPDLVWRWQGGIRLRRGRVAIEHSLHAVGAEVPAGRRQHLWGRLGATVWR